MAIRAGMLDLIARVRNLVGDPIEAGFELSDQRIQDALDEHQERVRYARLEPEATIQAGGAVTYLDYASDAGSWEGTAGLTLLDGAWGTLTPATSDLLRGHWTFAVEPTGPVLVVGCRYDVYGAAADLAEEMAATYKDAVDTQDPNARFSLSQKAGQYTGLAERLRRRQLVKTARMVRSDLA